MKRILTLAAVAASVFAFGEQQALDPTGITFRAGGVWSLDSGKGLGNMLGIGVDVRLPRSLMSNGESYLSGDWMAKSLAGKHNMAVPVLINQRMYLGGGEEPGRRLYAFAGLGFAVVDSTKSKTVFAGRVGAGTELGANLIAETSALITGEANGTNANTVGVYIGWRF